MDKPKVFIATPMYGGQCHGVYVRGLLTLTEIFRQIGWNAMVSMLFNESLITRGRNALVDNFLKTDCTHLFFIDSDIQFNAQEVPRMFEVDKDVICGIYPKKEINWDSARHAVLQGKSINEVKNYTGNFVINLVNYDGAKEVPMMEPVEIWNAGTGFMLIKRSVFEKMAAVCPRYINDIANLMAPPQRPPKEIDWLGVKAAIERGETLENLQQLVQQPEFQPQITMGRQEITEFFTTSIEPGTERLLSEDYHFCHVWRTKCGGAIHAAPWVTLAHMGSYLFEGQMVRSAPVLPAAEPQTPGAAEPRA